MGNSDPVMPLLREELVRRFRVLTFIGCGRIFPQRVGVRFITRRAACVGRASDIPLDSTLLNAHPCKVLVHHVIVKSPTSVLVGAQFLNGAFCVGVGAKDLTYET